MKFHILSIFFVMCIPIYLEVCFCVIIKSLESSSDDECVICDNEIKKEAYFLRYCQHFACKLCLDDWLKNKISCPSCGTLIIDKTKNCTGFIHIILPSQGNTINNFIYF
ncbi:E3 ubiquitin-protein ligase RNFT1-like isoform X2 [Daktulosphaira vitifoliae]|uniref:E3 ubiquitin-protein ligase RNFT1-like isoform X2 n=1 Tax=Daktulosphaira vitifoliae TaxID=58002 RepID=UPI0021A98F3C|nr:E3 ubiquitin-protein ligase RNFT1-like isoform X2 [Daktulosphaira vitifoliae]